MVRPTPAVVAEPEPLRPTEPLRRPHLWHWVIYGLVALIALFAVLPGLPGSQALVAYAGIGLVSLAATATIAGMGRLAIRPVWLGLGVAVVSLPTALIATYIGAAAFADAGRLIAMGALGLTAARAVQELAWVPAVCLAITVADAWSVFASAGITRRVVEQHQEALPWMTVRVPIAGSPLDAAAMIGITDLAFMGLFLGVALRFALPLLRSALALASAVPLTFALSVYVLDGRAVPALPLIALAFLAAHIKPLTRAVLDAVRPAEHQ